MKQNFNQAADVQRLAAAMEESTETGTMSNVQVENNESTDFKDEWVEGICGEWIFAYNLKLKLLLINNADGDYENIYNRLVIEDGETFRTKSEKVATNVEENEVSDTVGLIVSKDWCYGAVYIDWSNKEAVEEFLNS